MSGPPLVITPPELLLAIAEHEQLEATCAALPGMTRERAQRLLRGIAVALQRPQVPASPPNATRPKAHANATAHEVRSAPSAHSQAVMEPTGDASRGAAGQADRPHSASAGATGRVFVYSDGASRGNPGPAGAGAVLLDERGAVLRRLGKLLGRETNNIAEYQGLLLGLRAALEMGARDIEVRADSELMIKQLKGDYRVKNEGLKPLFAEAQALLRKFDRVKLRHVPREENKLADEMSNRAIDERM